MDKEELIVFLKAIKKIIKDGKSCTPGNLELSGVFQKEIELKYGKRICKLCPVYSEGEPLRFGICNRKERINKLLFENLSTEELLEIL